MTSTIYIPAMKFDPAAMTCPELTCLAVITLPVISVILTLILLTGSVLRTRIWKTLWLGFGQALSSSALTFTSS